MRARFPERVRQSNFNPPKAKPRDSNTAKEEKLCFPPCCSLNCCEDTASKGLEFD